MARLNFPADPVLRESFHRRFYLPLQVALEDAAELHTDAWTPQVGAAAGAACVLRRTRCGSPAAGSCPHTHALHPPPTPAPCSLLLPQVCLAVYEAWAAMGLAPMSSRPFGLAVRQQIKIGAFTPQARRLCVLAIYFCSPMSPLLPILAAAASSSCRCSGPPAPLPLPRRRR